MVNFLLETQNATKYYALSIVQAYISDKKLLPSTDIIHIIKNDVSRLLVTNEWKATYELIYNELTNKNNSTPELDKLLVKLIDTKNYESWANVINLYVLIAIVADICSKTDCKIFYVDKCVDACINKNVLNWIILHGGWMSFNGLNHKKNSVESYLENTMVVVEKTQTETKSVQTDLESEETKPKLSKNKITGLLISGFVSFLAGALIFMGVRSRSRK